LTRRSPPGGERSRRRPRTRVALYLSNLGSALLAWAGRTGAPADVDEAIDLERLLCALYPDAVTRLVGAAATRSALLATLPAHRRVHIAGHAVADLDRPSQSRLVLADHAERALTAADLGALRLPDAELAFLTACETARTAPGLSDEALHLGSVLHVAGYRHVVATLWAVTDRPAQLLSRSVHAELAEHDDLGRLAAAVHRAVCALRERYPSHPSVWAAYVHMGP
jgi:CHAT domain-containing protein